MSILEERLIVARPRAGQTAAFICSRTCGALAALLSFATVSFYVFVLTPYADFLFSDMGHYWDAAMQRLDGDAFADSQFIAWPPLYHILLAEVFALLRALGLDHLVRLETALTLHLIAFAVSVYAFQRIAVDWFVRAEWVAVAVLLYAFGFPSLYFNAFLLSGNIAAPLLIVAVAVVLRRDGWAPIVVGAMLFALATAMRPAFGPFGIAFVAMYLARHRFTWTFIGRAAVFTVSFFAIVVLASAEVSRISGGRVTGLSANGGLDFFVAMSHYHRVSLAYDGWRFDVGVPAYSFKPENGVYRTHVPFYEQDYYFRRGWEAIKRDPMRLFENFEHVRHLFFADMLPSRNDAPGFGTLIPIWDWFKFAMFLSLGIYAWMMRSFGARAPAFWLFVSMIALTLLESFFFTGEPRYTYSILFVFYLLFFKLIELMSDRWRQWMRPLAIYFALLAGGAGLIVAVIHIEKIIDPPTLRAAVTPVGEGESFVFDAGRMLFPYRDSPPLEHRSGVELPQRSVRVEMAGMLEVSGEQPLPVEFEVYSSWPTQLSIDGEVVLHTLDEMDFFEARSVLVTFPPGKHRIEAVFDYVPYRGGFAVSYGYTDGERREREIVGFDTSRVRFLRSDAPTQETP